MTQRVPVSVRLVRTGVLAIALAFLLATGSVAAAEDVHLESPTMEESETAGIGTQAMVSDCGIVDSPGEVELTTNVTTNDTCFAVTTSDVVLDGGGHTVTGQGVTNGSAAVVVDGTAQNVTIRNLTVENWTGVESVGIGLANASGVTVSDVTVTNSSVGLGAFNSTDSTLEDLTVDESTYGAVIQDTSGVDVRDTVVKRGIEGVTVAANASDTTLANVSGIDNQGAGIAVVNAGPTTIVNGSVETNAVGIGVQGATNTTVDGVSATGNGGGIDIQHSHDTALVDVAANGNAQFGLRTGPGSVGTDVSSSDVAVNGAGALIQGAVDTSLADLTAVQNSIGIEVANQSTGTLVSGGSVTGNANGGVVVANATGTTIDRVYIANTTARGVLVHNAGPTTVNGSLVRNNSEGIYAENVTELAVLESATVDNQGLGIGITGTSPNTTLLENTIANNSGYGIASWLGPEDLHLEGNGVWGNGLAGVVLDAVGENATVFDNELASNGGPGIDIRQTPEVTVENNSVTANDDHGISVENGSTDVRLTDNDVSHTAGSGISILHSDGGSIQESVIVNGTRGLHVANSSNTSIEANVVTGTDIGAIDLEGTTHSVVSGNLLTASGQTIGDGFGIRAVTATDPLFHNNTITTASDFGIYVQGGSAPTVSNSTVRNASVGIGFDSTGDGLVRSTTAVGHGEASVALGRTDGVALDSVNASGSTGGGILMFGGTNNTTVTRTLADDNGVAGIGLLPGTTNTTIENTTANGNDQFGIAVNSSTDTTIERVALDTNGEYGLAVTNGSSGTTLWSARAQSNGDGAVRTEQSGPTAGAGVNIGMSTAPNTTISFEGENVSVSAPATVAPHPTATPLERFVAVNELTGSGSTNLTVTYTDSDIATVDETALELHRFDGSEWIPVADSSHNASANALRGEIETSGVVGAFAPGEAPIVYNKTLPLDGSPHALGFPGPVAGSLADAFPDGLEGINAIFAYTDGRWSLVTDLDRDLEALDAIVLTTDDRNDSVPVQVRIAPNETATPRPVGAGWNFVAGTGFADAESSFGDDVNDSVLALQRYSQLESAAYTVTPFDTYVIGSDQWGGPAPTINPFTGYFVYLNAPSEIPVTLSNASDRAEADALLGGPP